MNYDSRAVERGVEEGLISLPAYQHRGLSKNSGRRDLSRGMSYQRGAFIEMKVNQIVT